MKNPANISFTGKRETFHSRFWKKKAWFFMFFPGLAMLIIFNYYPMYGIIIAFKDFNISKGIWESDWVGLLNFKSFISGMDFKRIMTNTVLISLYKLIFSLPVSVILSIFINEMNNAAFKKITQTVSYLPHFLSWVIVAGMMNQLLSPSTGIVNQIITFFGGKPVFFMASPKWFRTILVLSQIWKEAGWSTIIYLALLSQIDQEQYEAAIVDGANRIQRIININIPFLLPLIGIQLILSMGGILNAGFDQIFNMYNSRVLEVADIIDTYTYRVGMISMDYSYSAAVGLFKSVIGVIFIIITQVALSYINRKMGDREIYGLY